MNDSEDSVEIIAERQKGERRKPKVVELTKPSSISHALAASDGQVVITVTAEDKSINVFSFLDDGKLLLQSRRSEYGVHREIELCS